MTTNTHHSTVPAMTLAEARRVVNHYDADDNGPIVTRARDMVRAADYAICMRADVSSARRANWCAISLRRHGYAPVHAAKAIAVRDGAMRAARARKQAL
jgi:hypothetical protein